MPDQTVEETAREAARLFAERAVPSTGFVHTLGEEVHRAAYQGMGMMPTVPFEEMVVQLRKLVLLLRKTLVPICPGETFVRTLGSEIDTGARELVAVRQQRVRWMMVGGMLGSAISLLGVLTALVLRRRNGRATAKRGVGIL